MAVPQHVWATISPTKGVIRKIESMLSNFLWGSTAEGTKKHWSKWNSLCLPTNENGLGFRRIADIVQAYDYKLWWKFRTTKSSWANFLWSLEPNIRAKTTLKRTFHIEQDAMLCSKLIPSSSTDSGSEGDWIWMLNEAGNFTLSSAYQRSRGRGIINNFSTYIWHASIPLKISYFMWRLINFFLPFPDLLEKYNLHLPSKCTLCCAHSESMLHVFYNCPFSYDIWRLCWEKLKLPIRQPSSLMEALQILWNGRSFKGLHNILLSIFPSLFLWEIWKVRNAAFFSNKKPCAASILRSLDIAFYEISTAKKMFATTKIDQLLVQQSFGKSFPVKNARHPMVLFWKLPPVGFMKLNIHGFHKVGTGSGGGYVLRDDNGNLVEAAAIRLHSNSVFEAELDALHIGIKRCLARGIRNLQIEGDCKRLVFSLKTKEEFPWRWRGRMKEISAILKGNEFEINHVFKEINSVAEVLAKTGISTQDCIVYQAVDSLPSRARGGFILEKQKVPYVRL